ncbi:MAG TPA: hypothetical protein VF092_23975 [Longimicrobium sp.]
MQIVNTGPSALGGRASIAEIAILAVLVVLSLVAAWRFYVHWSGREKSDVNDLHFSHRK